MDAAKILNTISENDEITVSNSGTADDATWIVEVGAYRFEHFELETALSTAFEYHMGALRIGPRTEK